MALISDGRFVEDGWRRLADEETLPNSGKIIVSQTRLPSALEHRPNGATIGVIVANTLEPSELSNELSQLGLISIAFPAFGDGRGFSLARLLRRDGFTGELRASGRLLADQYAHAVECGFDTVEVPDDLSERQDEGQWRAALSAYSRAYQRGYASRSSILEARRGKAPAL